MDCCFNTTIELGCLYITVSPRLTCIAVLLSCCCTIVMLLCCCHVAFPLPYCFANHPGSHVLLCCCNAAFTIMLPCSCHIRLLVSYCFATCCYKPYCLVIAFVMLVGSIFPPSTVVQLGHCLPGCLFFFLLLLVLLTVLPCPSDVVLPISRLKVMGTKVRVIV